MDSIAYATQERTKSKQPSQVRQRSWQTVQDLYSLQGKKVQNNGKERR
jgi:hypothetical protein